MKKAIRNSFQVLSYLSAFFGLLTIIKSPPGKMGGLLWLPKLWAGAWAPLLAAAGAAGAATGWVAKDRKSLLAGLAGAALAIQYTRKVTAKHDHFAPAFGAHWQERIPEELKARLGKRRYTFIQPAPPSVAGQRDVAIGVSRNSNRPLLCDIWQPPADVPHTGLALIYFHGGAWQACDKDFLTQPLFRRLVSQGHVVMDVAYSLTPQAGLNDMLDDVKQAILWMKAHAQEYGVNPERVVLMGVSGGAHLALLAAYAPHHPAFQPLGQLEDLTVRGVISVSGITDLSAFFHEYGRTNPDQPEYNDQIRDELRPRIHDKTWLDKFLTRSRVFPAYRHANMPGGALLLGYLMGGTLKELPEAYRWASPIVHVAGQCPPTMLIHGADDFVVDVSHSRRLHRALCDAGCKCVYVEFPDTVHAFDQYFGVSRRFAPAAQAATFDIERFLALMI